jgi:hypothetical protein
MEGHRNTSKEEGEKPEKTKGDAIKRHDPKS